MSYGNDSESLLTTIQVDESLKARPEDHIDLNKGKRFIFNFEGKTAKVGPEGVQFVVTRK